MTLWAFDRHIPINRARHADSGSASGATLGALFAALFCLVLALLPGFPDRAWGGEARAGRASSLALARLDGRPLSLTR